MADAARQSGGVPAQAPMGSPGEPPPYEHVNGSAKPPKSYSQQHHRIAVEVSSLRLVYGSGAKALHVLQGIDLTVPEGAIYGLLGPSGCGKTTLLRCILGRLNPHIGSIQVFGKAPNSSESQVPGTAVGYMPQDIALYPEITIGETLTYFGKLYQLSDQTLAERMASLLAFLDLPDRDRLIQNLSGGQKRRVSLAVALIHNPPLLILDEPTVGVDPLLRESIWEHLVTLTSTEGMTVIITTHYVEEARQANVVGFMRAGRLLAEAPPDKLMELCGSNSLEDVFLKLCKKDIRRRPTAVHTVENGVFRDDVAEYDETKKFIPNGEVKNNSGMNGIVKDGHIDTGDDKSRSDSCASANTALLSPTDTSPVWLLRSDVITSGTLACGSSSYPANADEVAFQPFKPPPPTDNAVPASPTNHHLTYNDLREAPLIIPPFSRSSSAWSIKSKAPSFQAGFGKTMAIFTKNIIRLRRNLPLLLFQFMIPTIQVILFCICIGGDPFDLNVAVYNGEKPNPWFKSKPFGELFLNHLDRSDTVIQKRFENKEAALESVRTGETWAALVLPQNFSLDLYERVLHGLSATNETIEGSIIDVYPDITNQQVGFSLQKAMVSALKGFVDDALHQAGANPKLAEPIVRIQTPIYGSMDASYTEFMSPGVILAMLYIMAVGLTALTFVVERKDGLLDRGWVAGATTMQVMVSHIMTQFLVMTVQAALILIFTFLVFQIPCRGSMAWVIALTLMQGFCGMAYGLLISACCTEENTAIMMAMGSFYPNLLMSGIVWPVQAMPYYVRYVSYCLPQTLACEAMRCILFRGWDITYFEVWIGFAISFIWFVLFVAVAWFIVKIKK